MRSVRDPEAARAPRLLNQDKLTFVMETLRTHGSLPLAEVIHELDMLQDAWDQSDDPASMLNCLYAVGAIDEHERYHVSQWDVCCWDTHAGRYRYGLQLRAEAHAFADIDCLAGLWDLVPVRAAEIRKRFPKAPPLADLLAAWRPGGRHYQP